MKLRYLALLFLLSTTMLFAGKFKDFLKDKGRAERYTPIHVQNDMVLSIALDDDECFYVPLTENPTTGYQWEVEIDNPQCIEVKKTDFIAAQPPPPPHHGPDGKPPKDERPPMLCGAGGTKVFTFETKRSGTANLTFRYRRNWEKNTPPETEFTMIVFITE